MRVCRGGQAVRFQPAKFSYGTNAVDDAFVVTATGNFIVRWNFNAVKRGRKNSYVIQEIQGDRIIDENFHYGTDAVVAAAKDDVLLFSSNK